MAEAILLMVAESLEGLMVDQPTLSIGKAQQIRDAQKDLQSISYYLKDADAKRRNNAVVSPLVATTRDVAYELEEIVFKEVSLRIEIVGRRLSCIGVVGDRKFASKIERIRAQLSALISEFTSHGVMIQRATNESESNRSDLNRPIMSQMMATDESGSNRTSTQASSHGEIDDLARLLVRRENSPSVVSVCGMGGIGKTTLAKQVYQHHEVRDHFDCRSWVCLAQEFQPRGVHQEILTQLLSATDDERRDFAKMNASEIENLLKNTLQKNKCFIVLDDMWESEAWDSLKLAVLGEKTKSKILLTTRNREVASHVAGTGGVVYEVKPLREEESWSLFRRIAFSEPDAHSELKEELGKEMLLKCGGLPLAIIVLAGVLARKDTVEEWLLVNKNLTVNSLGNDNMESLEPISQVLKMSYDSLPGIIRICFQYLANFPDDCEVPVKTLTRLWIAEGFIPPAASESAETMEDVSYGYLNQLATRHMVQVVEHTMTGNIKTIGLHDLMRDMSRKMAEHENFLHIINSSNTTPAQASFQKIRRLAVHLGRIGQELTPRNDDRHASLRSLLFFVGVYYYSDIYKKLLRSVCRDFKFLRVLIFEDMKGEPEIELPSNIGNLVHLRFLSLKNSEIKRLPSSVANLVYMQTLDLRSVKWISVKVPNVFWRMDKLRHLYLPLNHRVTDKLSLATLCNLQTLANISSQDCALDDLIKLTNLRKLVLDARDPNDLIDLEKIVISGSITFNHLQSLSLVTGNRNGDIPPHIVLSCTHLVKLHLYGRIKVFPRDGRFSKLSKLTLEETNLEEQHVETLENLPDLKKLSLRMGAFKLENMVFSKKGFPQLKKLSLVGLCELKEWTVLEGAMPGLNSLHIGYCWNLRAVPDEIQRISTLKELTIERMTYEFCKRLEKGGADFDKFRHASVKVINKR